MILISHNNTPRREGQRPPLDKIKKMGLVFGNKGFQPQKSLTGDYFKTKPGVMFCQ